MMRPICASQQIWMPIDRSGSLASHRTRAAHGMSAVAPTVTERLRHSEGSRCAISGCKRMQQVAPLVDHFVGDGKQAGRNAMGRDKGFCLGGGRGLGSVLPATVGLLTTAIWLLCRHRLARNEGRAVAGGFSRGGGRCALLKLHTCEIAGSGI